jgi:hypothetical protein
VEEPIFEASGEIRQYMENIKLAEFRFCQCGMKERRGIVDIHMAHKTSRTVDIPSLIEQCHHKESGTGQEI